MAIVIEGGAHHLDLRYINYCNVVIPEMGIKLGGVARILKGGSLYRRAQSTHAKFFYDRAHFVATRSN